MRGLRPSAALSWGSKRRSSRRIRSSSLAFGYIVARFGNYDLPFIPMAALSLIGFLLWLKVDASQPLVGVAETGAA